MRALLLESETGPSGLGIAEVDEPAAADGTVLIEVSGGLTEANIAEYALPGVDILSVGSLTHSVRAIDLSLLVT